MLADGVGQIASSMLGVVGRTPLVRLGAVVPEGAAAVLVKLEWFAVEGIGIGFAPPLLDHALFDEVRPIDEAEGRAMARRLAREEGLLAGTSTGLNLVGAIALARELGADATVVTVACDTGLEYLSGDLYGQP